MAHEEPLSQRRQRERMRLRCIPPSLQAWLRPMTKGPCFSADGPLSIGLGFQGLGMVTARSSEDPGYYITSLLILSLHSASLIASLLSLCLLLYHSK